MSENILNSNCNNCEQIVSFLYGELTENEKNNFEQHLQICETCAVELGEFSDVHFSVQEWHNLDFQKLSTPNFEIPSNIPRFEDKLSRIESVRNFFTLHSAGFSAAAAAVILTFFSIFWFYNNPVGNNEVASNRSGYSAINAHSLEDKENSMAKNIETPVGDIEEKEKISEITRIENANKNEAEIIPVKTNVSKNINNSNLKKPNKILKAAKQNNTVEKASPKNRNIENIPTLAIDEDEDTSLRLSDIFEEVSMK